LTFRPSFFRLHEYFIPHQAYPLFQVGGGVTAVGYPIWAIWLGVLLINGKITPAA
jgi:hypothetical protein